MKAREREEERVTGDCINASYQGYFSKEKLKEDQTLDGLGTVIDDEFNFFLSEWKDNKLNGPSYMRMITNHIVYGNFSQNLPQGLLAINIGEYRIFISRRKTNGKELQWMKDAVVFNMEANIFYVVQLTPREQHENTIDLDYSQRAVISQTSRFDRVKIHWKIKIIERCPLKSDGSLSVYSKLLKSLEKKENIELNKSYFLPKELKHIELLSTVMGKQFTDASLISSTTFLRGFSAKNSRILLKEFHETPDTHDSSLFIGIANSKMKSNKRQVEKKIGLIINSSNKEYVRSLGNYENNFHLHGLGIQYNKFGESFIGVFKENLLVKEYKQSNSGSKKGVSTFQIRQLLSQQHLKSMNYIHHCHYVSELAPIIGISNRIIKYVSAFEKQFEKRHINYNDTLPYNSSFSSDNLNIHKYVDDEKNQETDSPGNSLRKNSTHSEFKKPGFILDKSKNKSRQKSPVPDQKRSPQKSPLRQIRMKGRLYGQSDGSRLSPFHSNGRSNQATLKKSYY